MIDLLAIGRSGLRAYSRSIETVSQNISNAENPDYVRRSTQLSDATVASAINPLYTVAGGQNGVRIDGLQRGGDDLLEAQTRQTGANRLQSETVVRTLGNIETVLDNGGRSVGTTLNRFFATGEELASVPFDSALRLTFLNDLETSALSFRQTAANLVVEADQTLQKANIEGQELTSTLANLAKINLDLTRTPVGTAAHATLLDSRDAALAVISEKLDVTVSLAGTGAATVTYDGATLVNLGVASTVTIAQNPDASLAILIDGVSTRSPASGILGGLSRSAQAIRSRQSDLDTLAQQFVDDINGWSANGRTDAGTPGGPLLAMTGGAASLVVTTQNIANLALGGADGSSNGNLLALSNLRGGGSVETNWNNYLAGHANALSAARSEAAASSALDQAARSARDSVAAVDIDREVADLVRFQQAYEASARVIQVARETLQSILSIF